MKFIPLAGRIVSCTGTRRSQTLSINLPSLLSSLVVVGMLWAGTALGATAERLTVASASASADDGNVPANTLDGSLTTRWSANGDGQWIRFDLGSPTNVGSVKIAWYKGNLRNCRFDIQTSKTGTDWTTVFTGQSSGTT